MKLDGYVNVDVSSLAEAARLGLEDIQRRRDKKWAARVQQKMDEERGGPFSKKYHLTREEAEAEGKEPDYPFDSDHVFIYKQWLGECETMYNEIIALESTEIETMMISASTYVNIMGLKT
jgi:hypothetical protein